MMVVVVVVLGLRKGRCFARGGRCLEEEVFLRQIDNETNDLTNFQLSHFPHAAKTIAQLSRWQQAPSPKSGHFCNPQVERILKAM
ncbi:hypothetical protein MLD38_016238 [Melastoma candidum]|uniref:Uncharacterized protein n=1 Tax=Melastoma candidum TaxID=119954 RepID=A0ACB9RIX8_9MYRT|nr:hypothetical protein MLD38_016238 [Melastoma candidum]